MQPLVPATVQTLADFVTVELDSHLRGNKRSTLKPRVALFLEGLDAFRAALVRHAHDVEFILVT